MSKLKNIGSCLKTAFNVATGRWTQLDPQGFPVFDRITNTGEIVSSENSLYVSTVFSCINLLASVIASLPLNIYNTETDEDIYIDKGNPLFKLLRYQPNKWQTAYDYWLYNVECMLLRGGFISWKNMTSSGKIMSLIPLNPDTVTRKQLSSGEIVISGIASWGYNQFMKFEETPQDEFFWANYRTLDGVNPCSIIKYACETIGMAKTLEKHGAKLIKNDATPPLIIKYPQGLDEKSAINIAKQWSAGSSGDNYGKPRFIDKGSDVVKLQMSNQDAQYLETRQFTEDELCAFFRVSRHFIKESTNKGWSTLSEMGEEFLSYTLCPYLTNIEQAVNRSLIPEKDWGVVFADFDTKQLTKANTVARTAYYRDMYYTGAMNSNEIRIAEGLNHRENGEIYYHQGNLLEDGEIPVTKQTIPKEEVKNVEVQQNN